jgi:hypothetical protein
MLRRFLGQERVVPPKRNLAGDARAIRDTLAALNGERQIADGSSLDLRGIVEDLLEGEVAAPTADVLELIKRDTDPGDFYAREIAPAWDGLGEAQRAARVEGFADLALMLDEAGEVPGLEPEIVRTKTLVLAWAFDETYGYLPRLARGESPTAD